MSRKGLKVALVADREGWVLDMIARAWAGALSEAGHQPRVVIAPARRTVWCREMKRWDAVHFFSPWSFIHLAGFTPVPVVVTVHHLTVAGDRLIRPRLKHAATVCVTNAAMHRNLAASQAADGWYCPLVRVDVGINPDEYVFEPASRAKDFDRKAFVIGFAAKKSSNDDDRKGLDRMWAVLRVLKHETQPVRLRFFGPTGPSEWNPCDVPSDIRSLVEFAGYLDRPNYLRNLSSLDCYLSLSRVEGGPYPVLEKMACGGVILSTPVGIVPELVRSGENGFIVSGDDVGAIVEQIRALMCNPSLADEIGKRAQDDCWKRYGWKSVFARQPLSEVYQNALTWAKDKDRLGLKVRRWRCNLIRFLSKLRNR